jgi:hypothetical protein
MNPRSDPSDTLQLSSKIIHNIKRHRKQRHIKLRDMTKDEEEDDTRRLPCDGSGQTLCPVCLQNVRGDQDVMEAHIDACLAFESDRTREHDRDVDVEDSLPERVTDEASFRGMSHPYSYVLMLN